MKVIQIAGFLGSGKTTAMVTIAKALSRKYGKKVAIIVNEIGNVPVDARLMEEYGLKVSELGGGCICCELLVGLADTLVALSRAANPDIVLIEPTGVSVPDQVKDGIVLSAAKASVEVGPAVVLYDVLIDDELMEGDPTSNFVLRQMAVADIIAINKIDTVDETKIIQCEKRAHELNPGATLLRLSALRGDGMNELIDSLVKEIA
jgi:G3E family GTPase